MLSDKCMNCGKILKYELTIGSNVTHCNECWDKLCKTISKDEWKAEGDILNIKKLID